MSQFTHTGVWFAIIALRESLLDHPRSGAPRTGHGVLLLNAKVQNTIRDTALSIKILTQLYSLFFFFCFLFCVDMTRIKTGFYFLTEITCPSPNVRSGFWTGAHKKLYQYRDTISIECNLGYIITGSRTSTCGKDGRWFPNLPKCTRTCKLSILCCI